MTQPKSSVSRRTRTSYIEGSDRPLVPSTEGEAQRDDPFAAVARKHDEPEPADPFAAVARTYGEPESDNPFAAMTRRPNPFPVAGRSWKEGLDRDPYGPGEIREYRPARRENSFIFSPKPEFPAFLRKAREAAGLSIRQAAPALGISAAYLSRLETGGPARQPSMDRLNRMAELYNVEKYVMLGEAGIELDKPDDLDLADHTDADFEAVMLHDEIRPAMLTQEALNYFSPRMKRQILELVRKLCRHGNPGALYQSILPWEAETE